LAIPFYRVTLPVGMQEYLLSETGVYRFHSDTVSMAAMTE